MLSLKSSGSPMDLQSQGQLQNEEEPNQSGPVQSDDQELFDEILQIKDDYKWQAEDHTLEGNDLVGLDKTMKATELGQALKEEPRSNDLIGIHDGESTDPERKAIYLKRVKRRSAGLICHHYCPDCSWWDPCCCLGWK